MLWEFLYMAVFVPPGQPPYPRSILDIPEIAVYARDWGRPHDRGFIAEDGGIPVGAAWLRLLSGDERGYGYVDERTPELCLSVAPERRGRSIGTQLLTRLIDAACGDYSALCLSVDEINPARRLYERFGFQVVGRKEGSLVMVLKVNPHHVQSF